MSTRAGYTLGVAAAAGVLYLLLARKLAAQPASSSSSSSSGQPALCSDNIFAIMADPNALEDYILTGGAPCASGGP